MVYDEACLREDSFYINDCVVVDNDYELALNWIYNEFESLVKCPFCSVQLAVLPFLVDKAAFTFDPQEYLSEQGQKADLRICVNCSYWQWQFEDGLDMNCYGCPDHFWHTAVSKVREYASTLPLGCYSEIAVALRRRPDLCHSITPKELEKFVAAVFKANYSDCEVFHVGRPDDGGVDVVFVDSGKNQWLIQVKRREHSKSSEGVGTIRNLLGTMVLEDCSNGIVVSTADHFTHRAYQASGRANEKGYTIKLVDRGKLLRLAGPLLPRYQWRHFIDINYPDLGDFFFKKGKLIYENFRSSPEDI